MNPPHSRLRPRQRGRAEAGAESGAAAIFHADPRRVPAACPSTPGWPQHLRFAGLEETFVLETGDMLEIDQHGARQGGRRSRWAASASIPARSTKWWRTWSSATGGICPKTASCCRSSPSTSTPARSEGLPEIVSRGLYAAPRAARIPAGGARSWWRDARNLAHPRNWRLGRHAGEDPRGPEALI